ncbi:hypothetical protein [Vibrio caribbeanicus]|uniref:hypothetical protein n=1 Tax=Vibrio caribbeanicus TaxID=701175 RepID=UPI00228432AB|nr:hypothetical protein [Vibrio caribbeanicus]MCY9843242.1 hypothetical protein [Vibrio caribbeanicus]
MGNKKYQDMLTAKQALNSNAEHWTIAFLDSIEDLVESFYLALGFNYDNFSDSSNRPLIEITHIDDKKQYPKNQTLIRYSEKAGAQYSVSSQQPFFWYSDKASLTDEIFKMTETQF